MPTGARSSKHSSSPVTGPGAPAHSGRNSPHRTCTTPWRGTTPATSSGYAGIALLGNGSHPESEIHTIGTDPACQRRGIGGALLDELLRVADARGGPVFLEVRTDNDAAIALYRREGFEIVGTRKKYYQPSGADAFTMRRPGSGEEPVQ